MKAKVLQSFYGKENPGEIYRAGQVYNIEDGKVDELSKRGLIEVIKAEKPKGEAK
jgi:hypothetical protein